MLLIKPQIKKAAEMLPNIWIYSHFHFLFTACISVSLNSSMCYKFIAQFSSYMDSTQLLSEQGVHSRNECCEVVDDILNIKESRRI